MKKTPSTDRRFYAQKLTDVNDLLAKTTPNTTLHTQLLAMKKDITFKLMLFG